MPTLKISENQAYRIRLLIAETLSVGGIDTLFLDCEPKSKFYCRDMYFESVAHFKGEKRL